jgi:branched-chain amino acid transport system permease protein
MFYFESGQFKKSYAEDQAILPIRQDRIGLAVILALGFIGVPLILNDYLANAIFIPFLVYALAALGLNILVGYCGQLSLGTGAFLGVGAYACYKLTTAFPDMNLIFVIILSGGVTALVGMLFGLPSLRIKGFYLAVATLAAQFFIIWLFYKVPWLTNYSATGQISMPPRDVFGFQITGPEARPIATYLFVLSFVSVFALIAKNMVRSRVGRTWMAIRDMDIAAELIGIRPLRTKLMAFGVSSFYVGMAGAMLFGIWLGAAEAGETFGIDQSFLVLFMIIIGGLGSILGSFLGAGFITLVPIFLKQIMVDGMGMAAVTAKHVEIVIFGVLIVFFLIVEPHGLARLWRLGKEKLRRWPFPY